MWLLETFVRMGKRLLYLAWIGALLACLCPQLARAHPLSFGSARLQVAGGELTAELVLDVPDPVLEQAESQRKQELLKQVESGLELRSEGAPLSKQVQVIDLGRGDNAVDIVRVRTQLPKGARALNIGASRELGDLAVELSVRGEQGAQRALVSAGEPSRTLSLAGASLPPSAEPGAESGAAASGAGPTPSHHVADSERTRDVEANQPRLGSLFDYLRLGFWHIIPEGIDHILFVLSLIGLVAIKDRNAPVESAPHSETTRSFELRTLIVLLSLFTLGHAVSVALSLYGGIALDADVVEPLIAASLAYAAFEAWCPRLAPLRPLVVTGFGLLHGSGFAGALARVRVPENERWLAMLGFNAGVELGQVVVAVLPWIALQALVSRVLVSRIGLAALRLIAVMGLLWAVARVLS